MVKIGDRVRHTRCEYDNEYGLEGTVLKVCEYSGSIFVQFDDGQQILLWEPDITLIEAEAE